MEHACQPHVIEHEHGNHTLCDPDECFAAKCAYWRKNGAFGLAIPEGWRGPSLKVREANAIAEARSNGYEPERVR